MSDQALKEDAVWELWKTGRLPSSVRDYVVRNAVSPERYVGAFVELGRRNPDIQETAVRAAIRKFVRSYPLCCQIVQPDYYGDQTYYELETPMTDAKLKDMVARGYIGDMIVIGPQGSTWRETRFPVVDYYFRRAKFRLEHKDFVTALGMADNCGEFSPYSGG